MGCCKVNKRDLNWIFGGQDRRSSRFWTNSKLGKFDSESEARSQFRIWPCRLMSWNAVESNSSSCFNILFHNVRLSNVKNSNHLYVWCKSNTVKRFHAFTKKRHIKPYHFQIHLSFFNRYKALEKMKIHNKICLSKQRSSLQAWAGFFAFPYCHCKAS